MNNSESTRLPYLDITRGFGILLIVSAHCMQYFSAMHSINRYVVSFHVPLFFIVSGMIAYQKRKKQEPFLEFVKKRANQLLVPDVWFSLFNSALKLGVLWMTHALTKEALQSELLALCILGNGTVWFLATLFGVEVVFWAIKRLLLHNCWQLNLAVVCAVAFCFPYFVNTSIPVFMVLLRMIAGLAYYLLGYCLGCFLEKVSRNIALLLAALLICAGVVVSLCYQAEINFFDARFTHMIPSVAASVCSSVGWLLLFFYFDSKTNCFHKVLSYCGQNSLIIMLVHPTVLLFFTYPLAGRFSALTGGASVAAAIALILLVLALEVPCIWLINHKFAWLLGKKTERD